MKKIILLALMSFSLCIGSCSTDESPTIVENEQQQQEEQLQFQDYKILDTNIEQLTIMIMRDSVWIEDPSYVNQDGIRIIPVLDKDHLIITSSGELTSPEKPDLWISFNGDEQIGDAHAIAEDFDGDGDIDYGQEFIWEDVIGKNW